MFTIFLVSVGLVAAAAASAAHRPLPLDVALPVGALGLAWRSAGERNTRNGKRTLWKGEGDTMRYSRAYAADREGMRAVGFSWDGGVPVCWEAIPAPVPYAHNEAISAAEARADAADRAKERDALAKLEAEEAEFAAACATRTAAIDRLRACLSGKPWAWNRRKRELAESLLVPRPSARAAWLATDLVDEVEAMIAQVTARLGEEVIADWWERAGLTEVRAAVHEANRVLSGMDEDFAAVRNGIGWSAAHSHAGHVLASLRNSSRSRPRTPSGRCGRIGSKSHPSYGSRCSARRRPEVAAQLTLAMPAPGVTSEEEARVHAYVDNILPKGVPTYVRRVLALRPLAQADVAALRPHASWMGPTPQGFVATVEVFDGGTIDITVTGPLGGAGYSWSIPDGGAPIWWCGRWNRWVRDTKGTARRKADDG